MAVSLSSLSTEYIRVEVTAYESGALVDPTSKAVSFAFITGSTEPSGGDWKTGEWETDPAGPTYYARILVGPSGETLADGRYNVWLKIAGSPEIPVRRVGVLTIT